MNERNDNRPPVETPGWISRVISEDRFRTYLEASNSVEVALDDYRYNLTLSGSLMPWVSFAEVTIRNALFQELCAHYNEVEIFNSLAPLLSDEGKNSLRRAEKGIIKDGAQVSDARIVTELTLSFWKYLLSARYEATLWTPALRLAFPHLPTKNRSLAYNTVEHIQHLRNRLAHSEPVYRRNLALDMANIRSVIAWISPEAAEWSNTKLPRAIERYL